MPSSLLFGSRSFVVLAATAMLSTFAMHCSGGAGDHTFYRLYSPKAKLEAACYHNGQIPENIKDDTSTMLTPSTVLLVRDGADTYSLDTGSQVISGSKSGSSYTFSGTTTNVEVTPVGAEKRTVTVTTTLSVSMTVDGRTATGTLETDTKTSCSGACTGFTGAGCKQTNTFTGIQVDQGEVTLEASK
ncbi:MAG: hypothetical protein IPK71_04065 [Myxococcales bacterium]|nr:hypothetical protein [Myxococcales bacterium]